MADTPMTIEREAHEALEKQVAQLRREVSRINRALSDRAEETAEQVAGWYDGASGRASRATQALRARAHTVSEAVKDNPGTVSSAVVLGGLIGFALGLAVTHASDNRHNRWF